MIDYKSNLAVLERLAAIAAYDLDHPDLRRRLDELTSRTAQALQMPISLVTLVLDSAEMFAGTHGLPDGWIAGTGGTPAEWSFCARMVVDPVPYSFEDGPHDPDQHDNPLVTIDGVVSYAGAPLVTAEGHVLGGHCVVGVQPHHFTPAELAILQAGAAEATAILEEYRLPH